jgi:hypothetical protein
MTEETNQDFDIFDADNAVVTSPLAGKKGVVLPGSEFIRHNYGGSIAELVTALKLNVHYTAATGDPASRNVLIGTGALKPSETNLGAPADKGLFLAGGAKLNKQSALTDFLAHLKASGFPMATMREKGSAALDGAAFIWTAKEVKINKKDTKVRELPLQFLGFEDTTGLAVVVTNPQSSSPASGPVAAPVDDAVRAEVTKVVLETLAAEPSKEIPRSQLAIKAGGKFAGLGPKRPQALALLLQDAFLGSLPGVTFDKKTVKLTEPVAA